MKIWRGIIALCMMTIAVFFTGITAQAAEEILNQGQTVTKTDNDVTYYKIVVPYNGYLHISMESDGGFGTFFYLLRSDKTTEIASFQANSYGNDDVYHAVKKGQVFYVKADAGYGSSYYSLKYDMTSANLVYNNKKFNMRFTNETLNNGVYVAVRTNQIGRLCINTNADAYFYMQLCNNRKYPISYGNWVGNYYHKDGNHKGWVDTTEYGVNRGIYYLKFYNNTKGSNGSRRIAFTTRLVAAYAPAANIRRAVNLPYNRAVTTAFIAGTRNNSWYQIRLNAPRILSLYTNARFWYNTRDSYYVTVYRYGSNRPISRTMRFSGYTYTRCNANGQIQTLSNTRGLRTSGRLGRGTYYVLVSTNSIRATGAVTVWWR